MTRRLRRRSQNAVDTKSRRQSAARRLEVDVARAGVVRIAYKEIYVPDDRGLVRQVADVSGEVVLLRSFGGAGKFDEAFGAVGESFDQPVDFGR